MLNKGKQLMMVSIKRLIYKCYFLTNFNVQSYRCILEMLTKMGFHFCYYILNKKLDSDSHSIYLILYRNFSVVPQIYTKDLAKVQKVYTCTFVNLQIYCEVEKLTCREYKHSYVIYFICSYFNLRPYVLVMISSQPNYGGSVGLPRAHS